jgi:hypothetical protein
LGTSFRSSGAHQWLVLALHPPAARPGIPWSPSARLAGGFFRFFRFFRTSARREQATVNHPNRSARGRVGRGQIFKSNAEKTVSLRPFTLPQNTKKAGKLRKSGEFASPSQSMAPEAGIGSLVRSFAQRQRRAWPLSLCPGAALIFIDPMAGILAQLSTSPSKGAQGRFMLPACRQKGRYFLKTAWILASCMFSTFCIGK